MSVVTYEDFILHCTKFYWIFNFQHRTKKEEFFFLKTLYCSTNNIVETLNKLQFRSLSTLINISLKKIQIKKLQKNWKKKKTNIFSQYIQTLKNSISFGSKKNNSRMKKRRNAFFTLIYWLLFYNFYSLQLQPSTKERLFCYVSIEYFIFSSFHYISSVISIFLKI